MEPNDIVISGISGRFPNSNNVREFSYNLYNKIDMTDEDESRWKHFHSEVPRRFGKIRNLEKFDASFFSTLNKHANWTDPQMRILLEHAYEAILDAGISPQSLIGSRTGVFVGCSISDSKDAFVHNNPPKDGYVVLGNANFYLSNRISYALGLCGPSFTVDTACSSSAYALDCAFRYLESGICDAALVGGTQLILNCGLASEYTKLGILASDGVCRPFDDKATGFSRADTICVIFLQKLKDSKRIYANLVYSSSNNDGFKKEGASFPSKIMQQRLIEDFYKTLKFDPGQVNFVEAHSTGTKLGDPEEVAAIDEVFCKNNNRSGELVIGSVKSNMGHAEAASGMASIAKILVALDSKKFPPNINLTSPRSDVPAFAEGRIKVATEPMELQGQFIAMNSFGLGGGNAHSLFCQNLKEKINRGIPDDDLGRMVLWSGRTEEAINAIFDDVIQRPLDAEHIALLQNSQVQTTLANTYRGFGMFTNDANAEHATCIQRDIQYFNGTRRPIVFVYSGIGSQWPHMGADLMKIPLFYKSIDYCHGVLMKKGIDLKSILTLSDKDTFNNVLHSYVGIVAIEIALTNLLKALDIVPDYIIGHSVGELACSYADGCFTAEETILAAYARGESSNECETIEGAMAAIGMHHTELVDILPPDIDIACHNAIDSTTISGPIESVKAFVDELKEKKIFAKEVACSGVPLHSRYITQFGEKLNDKLQEIITRPKLRSKKWLSSTYTEYLWSKDEASFSSAEYHTKNLLNPVFFEEITEMLPKNSLTIEIAPHGLLKAILKKSFTEGLHVSLTHRDNEDGMRFFMEALGRLFQHGVDMDISKLYPPIQFPVSRATPMISPVIKWNHEENHYVPHFDSYNTFERRNIIINISDKKFEFIQGHIIDGRVLFPATGWIFLVWETLAMMMGIHYEKVKVIFEQVRFLRATSLAKNEDVLITISIHRGTGRFEVIEGTAAVVHGYIRQVEDVVMSDVTVPNDKETVTLQADEFYKEMRLNGFCHLGTFMGVTEIRHDGLKGKIKWMDNWITFLDSMTHFEELETNARSLALPTNIRKIVIDPLLHYKMLAEKLNEIENRKEKQLGEAEEQPDILYDVEISPYLRIIQAGSVEIHDKRNRMVNRRRPRDPLLEIHQFIPFFTDEKFTIKNAAKIVVQTVLDSVFQLQYSIVEIDSDEVEVMEPFSEFLSKSFYDTPLITSTLTLLTSRENLRLENVDVSAEEISSFNGMDMIIKSNCMEDIEFIENAQNILTENKFILARESKAYAEIPLPNLQLITMLQTIDGEFLHLLQFKNNLQNFEPENIIEITSNVEDWLDLLQLSLKKGPTLIYSHNADVPSGIVGFMNCLRREFPDKLKCFFINDSDAPPFDIENSFYRHQLNLNHTINIFKDGSWGSYRYVDMLPELNVAKSQEHHFYANCLVKGDLSTLAWLNGPLNVNDENADIVTIQYSSLNFKDIMLSLGRIPENTDDDVEKQCVLGFEFSGIKKDGKRVMGIGLNAGALATHYAAKNAMLWNVPDIWSLEEAATIPLVYFTVYFAFFITTKIQKGKTILIHSGSGGVGQAAIEIAFAYGLDVFTTVSTDEKKNFLLKKFPKLKPENIGNSRNTTFEKMILENTNGNGVDYVLNSLSDDKLQASIRCLGMRGTLLEIGKYDMVNGTQLDMRYLTKRIDLKAVIFDDLPEGSEEMKTVYDLVDDDVKSGIIKPLNTTIFDADDIEEAFRFMASGKHIGKVLLKVRENENDAVSLPLATMDHIYCDPNESYIIVGGLGGFGLELAEWLVLRRCKKLVVSSSRGITNCNQLLRIELWKRYGATVVITTADVTTEDGSEKLINTALELGPVGGIFNLAVVLRDGIFENLNMQMFNESLGPKAKATRNLDKISRKLCSTLKHFVVFSSMSCGRGNAGQSIYGMANSVMERIIEDRQKIGLPAKAIQWGAIGDVGMLAEFQLNHMGKDIGGTLPQAISSCIEVLDRLLMSTDAIVSSMVVADKHISDTGKRNIIDMILKIMGVRDRKSISMDSTLTQLGIDSLMGVEIQQVLERDFDISFTSQDLRSLTLNQLEKRAMSKNCSGNDNSAEAVNDEISWMRLLLEGVVDEETMELHSTETIVKANDVELNGNTKILIIPGFYGVATDVYRNLAKVLHQPAFILQLLETATCSELDEVIEEIAPHVAKFFSDVDRFILIGHSFGTVLALKLANKLENNGKCGHIILLDGSPQYINRMVIKMSPDGNDDVIRQAISMVLFDFFMPLVDQDIVKRSFQSHEKWEDKVDAMLLASQDTIPYSYEFIKQNIFTAVTNRFLHCLHLKEDSFSTLESTHISLVKASQSAVNGTHKDYGLARYCTNQVSINVLDGDHVTVVNNLELPKLINELLAL